MNIVKTIEQANGHLNPETFGNGVGETKVDPKELFRGSILDQTKEYPLPTPILLLNSNGERFPIFTKKSYSLLQGKQKSKKTTVLALAIAQYISRSVPSQDICFEAGERGAVLFFDNEQGESYAARTMNLILKLSDADKNENLIYCDLREHSPTQRLEIIKAGIEATPNVKWVVIDGIVDIMNDFMSAEEGHFVVTDLLKLCSQYDIHVTGVLHQNKGAQSKDARAHVGSISSQKCEIEIMVEKDQDDPSISVVSAKESRGLPFGDFAIRWAKGELPEILQDYSPEIAETTKKKKPMLPGQIEDISHVEILKKVLRTDSAPKLGEFELGLLNEISSWYGFKVPKSTASEYRKYYVDNGFVRTEGKTPHTKYLLNDGEIKH